MTKRGKNSKIYKLRCNRKSLKLKENLLFRLKNTRTSKLLKKNSSIDWKTRSKSSRMKMSPLLSLNQLVKQVTEKRLSSGRSNVTRQRDNMEKSKLNSRKKKLFGQANTSSKINNRNNSSLTQKTTTRCSKITSRTIKKNVMIKRARLFNNTMPKCCRWNKSSSNN